MRVERGEATVLAARVEIVDQQAHAHAAIGRLQGPRGQQPPGEVVVPEVGLHIEALRGLPGRMGA